jgi:hypothetical protein
VDFHNCRFYQTPDYWGHDHSGLAHFVSGSLLRVDGYALHTVPLRGSANPATVHSPATNIIHSVVVPQ